jgi:hypothetical protein
MCFQYFFLLLKKAGFFLFLLGLYAFPSFCQNEAINWPLGPVAGLTFKSGTAEMFEGGAIAATSVAAAISDANGNLLFYTDGASVWDKTHKIMPNGKALGGSGYSARVQICPKPGDPSKYYIFTTSVTFNWGVPNDVARYSEVDLCLNNGLGDVVTATKNIPLTSVTATRGAIVKHANGTDYWVTFHRWESNQFYSFKVTSNGVNPTPVVSAAGSTLALSSNSTGDGGGMKFSSDGKRLGMVIGQYATAEVFDFDTQTGIFSNAIKIPAIYRQSHYTPDYTHDIEFSPDSRKLYLTRTDACLLTQYDLTSGDQDAIVKSRVILAGDTLQHNNYDYYRVYGLQLGPDGKIYASWIDANSSGISVIQSPNEPGTGSNYLHDIIRWQNTNIAPHYFHSFPNFAASFFNSSVTIKNDFTCLSASINFQLKFYPATKSEEISNVHWNFDDPSSGVFDQSQELDAPHTFTTSGKHEVTCVVTWKNNTTSTVQQIVDIPEVVLKEDLDILPEDVVLCEGSTVSLDASKLGNVRWQDGSIGSRFTVSEPGQYWFSTCIGSCSAMDSVRVLYEEVSDVLGPDTTYVDGRQRWSLAFILIPLCNGRIEPRNRRILLPNRVFIGLSSKRHTVF